MFELDVASALGLGGEVIVVDPDGRVVLAVDIAPDERVGTAEHDRATEVQGGERLGHTHAAVRGPLPPLHRSQTLAALLGMATVACVRAKSKWDFLSEVGRRFDFLVESYGMAGPEGGANSTLVRYVTSELVVAIYCGHDPHDHAGQRIDVSVDPVNVYRAELPDLVEAAVFAPRHKVAWKAHTDEAARATLDDQALWLRRLMPLLVGLDGVDLIRRANAHTTDRAGNPKRRPRNIKWVYG